jgi:hypothetical protein
VLLARFIRKRNKVGPHLPLSPTLTPQKSLPHGAISIVLYSRPRDEKAEPASATVQRPQYGLAGAAACTGTVKAALAARPIDKQAARWNKVVMAGSSGDRSGKRNFLRRAGSLAILSAIGLFVIQTAWKALNAPWQVEDFPDALYIKVELLPWIFPAHMIAGGLALLLIPVMIGLSRYPRWHRPFGWIVAPVVGVAGVTAFPVALMAPVTPISAWGFAAQGAVWGWGCGISASAATPSTAP